MKVVITQPRYLPNESYLQRIADSDIWIVLNDVQRNGRAFENRNILFDKHWLTIPILGSKRQKIKECKTTDDWSQKHINKIYALYPKCDKGLIQNLYGIDTDDFTKICVWQTKVLIRQLSMSIPKIIYSSDYPSKLTGRDRIYELLKMHDATEYLTGKSCFKYGVNELFLDGIKIKTYDVKNKLPVLHYLCDKI